MIKNERQYRITRAQAERFDQALTQLRGSPARSADVHPLLMKAQEDALLSQLDDLKSELAEYDALRSGREKVLQLESFDDLPRAIIQARIASGLSQKQLAARLGLAEQQIQQYEASEYASVSFTRIHEVIDALGILVREDVFLPGADVSARRLFQRLQSVGIDRSLVLNRLLPRPLAAIMRGDPNDGANGLEDGIKGERNSTRGAVLRAAAAIGRVFRWKPVDIFSDSPLRLDANALASVRFKLPSRVNEDRVRAYTAYAHYLSRLTLETTRALEPRLVPADPLAARRAIIKAYGAISFENALSYVWSLGIPVLPLGDNVGFYGACWRMSGRNVIVLAQQTRFLARWLVDLLHESRHVGQCPEEQERAVIETEDTLGVRSESGEEDARLYAEDVVFGGRSDEIASKCVQQAGLSEGLSKIVPRVASEEGVLADALAYLVAYRQEEEGKNWWGAATDLQDRAVDPWRITRDAFFSHADLGVLNEADRTLLIRALTELDE